MNLLHIFANPISVVYFATNTLDLIFGNLTQKMICKLKQLVNGNYGLAQMTLVRIHLTIVSPLF